MRLTRHGRKPREATFFANCGFPPAEKKRRMQNMRRQYITHCRIRY
jgi:hypothetical protein